MLTFPGTRITHKRFRRGNMNWYVNRDGSCTTELFFFTSLPLLTSISFVFPSLKTLGEDLVTVLDFLHVKYVIGLGEGAGANVLARFGLAHPSRCLGLILINCTGSAASVIQSFKTKVSNSRHYNNNRLLFGSHNFVVWLSRCLAHSLSLGKVMRLPNRLRISCSTINLVT